MQKNNNNILFYVEQISRISYVLTKEDSSIIDNRIFLIDKKREGYKKLFVKNSIPKDPDAQFETTWKNNWANQFECCVQLFFI